MSGTNKHNPGPDQHYERVRRLGTDGPFRVEVAWSPSGKNVEQTVLRKRLRPGWQITEPMVDDFIQDALRSSMMVHPHIVRVLHAGRDEQGLFVITEYIHGVKLTALLRRIEQEGQSLSRLHVLDLADQCCEALEHAHRKGSAPLVHGALGPDHVMITFDGTVRVKDFGLWRLLAAAGELRHGGLDPESQAPEQRAGQSPGPRSDLFALARLVRILLDRAPEGGNAADQVLDHMLEQCLGPDPRTRPRDASALRRALHQVSGWPRTGQGRSGLGSLLRAQFTSRKPPPRDSTAATGSGGSSRPARGADGDLLDPAMFWSESEPEASPPEQDTVVRSPEPTRPSRARGEPPPAPGPAPPPGQPEPADAVELPAGGPPQPPAGEPVSQAAPPPPPAPLIQPGTLDPLPPASGRPLEDGPAGAASASAKRSGVPPRPPVARPVRAVSRPGTPRGRNRTRTGWWWLVVVLAGGAGIAAWQSGLLETAGSGPGQTGPEPGERNEQPARQAGDTAGAPGGGSPPPTDQGPSGPAAYVELKLTSEPPGAVVFLDGQKRGATPTVLEDVPAGEPVEVRFELDGHRTWKDTYTFAPDGQPREIHAGLLTDERCKAGTGWVYVSSEPPGATIELDGKRLPGKTPKIIDQVCSDKEHTIRLKHAGYRAWRHRFWASRGEVVNVRARLEK